MQSHVLTVGVYDPGGFQMDRNIAAPVGSYNVAAGMMADESQDQGGNHLTAGDMRNDTEIKLSVAGICFWCKAKSAALVFMYMCRDKCRML